MNVFVLTQTYIPVDYNHSKTTVILNISLNKKTLEDIKTEMIKSDAVKLQQAKEEGYIGRCEHKYRIRKFGMV